ncbi:hypothetical protein L596_001574 [Steinernema carpocapsae]|uniref:Proteasome subunit beta n=1 Tax=Steinernema carpocapsae TaxID=34508 RepID=A0A4U8UNM8_STECR|nr:hypothetical protein L596_001574 [Steinernema carpocapsae]
MSIMSYHGGTVLAMAGNECVCIGSDLRLGEQMTTVATDVSKVAQVGDRVFVGIGGFHTDVRTIMDKMEFRCGLYKLRERREVRPEVAALMLSNLLYHHRFGSFLVQPIVAGLDMETMKPYICGMDTIGCIASPRDFVAVGTGAEYLLGVSEGFWQDNMNPDELFEATAQSLLSGLERDAASGWGAVIHTITKDKVNVKTIKARMD